MNTDVSSAKISVVNNPIELEFEKEALQWSPGGSDRIFFVGSLGTRKGLFDIIEALVLLKQRGVTPPVTIAGPEERRGARAALESLVAEHGLEYVTLMRPVLGPEKLTLFKGNGIFLFPSHKENFPLVVIESAAAARAPVATVSASSTADVPTYASVSTRRGPARSILLSRSPGLTRRSNSTCHTSPRRAARSHSCGRVNLRPNAWETVAAATSPSSGWREG